MNRVLVAGTSLHFWFEERDIVALLSRRFPDEVVHRLHPRRGGSWEWPAMLKLKNQIAQAWCVVAAFSTVTIEAALMGRPAILVGFGNGPQGRVLDHWAYEHMATVASWPTSKVAHDEDELVRMVANALARPLTEEERDDLRARALLIADCRPGLHERIARAIEAAR